MQRVAKHVASPPRVRFVQPNQIHRHRGDLICPVEHCGHRFTEKKNLYKHYRKGKDDLHKKLADAVSKQRHKKPGLCDPSRRSGDEGLPFTASTPSINNTSKSLRVIDHIILPANGSASGRVNPQDKINQAFFDLDHESKTLLQLFCFLDGAAISEFMLLRAKRPQAIWGSTGEVEEVTPIEAGLRSDVISLVSNESEVKRAVDLLEASTLITSEPGPYGGRIVHLDSTTQLRLAQYITDPLIWRLQASLLVCHTFPMHQYLEPVFGPLGRLQINQVQHLAKNYHLLGDALTSSVKHKIAEVLLAASNFLTISWKTEALKTFKAITRDEPADYLQAWASAREYAWASLSNDSSIMSPIIRGQVNARANAFHGQWLLAYRANSLICSGSVITEFRPMNHSCPSTMEKLVLKKKEVTEGQIFRYLGDFQKARVRLTLSLDPRLDVVTHSSRISHLAAVHCELGEPEKACRLLVQDLDAKKSVGLYDVRSGIRVRLALAEAQLEVGRLKDAKEMYQELQETFSTDPDTIHRISKVRICIGYARISHVNGSWLEALEWWERVLDTAKECGWKEGFIQMIAHYSIGLAKSKLGRPDFQHHLGRADNLFRQEPRRQFWWTGLGTSWWDRIRRELSVLRGPSSFC